MINEKTTKLELALLFVYHRLRQILKKILDLINLLIILPSYLKKKKDFDDTKFKNEVKKILIINLQGIGDLLMMTPMIESLKASTMAKIDILCVENNGDIFKYDKRIKKIRHQNILKSIMMIRNTKYDLVISPYRAEHAGLITALSNAKYKIGYIYSLNICSNNIKLEKTTQSRDTRIKSYNILKALKINAVRRYDDLHIILPNKKLSKIQNILKKYANNNNNDNNNNKKNNKKIIVFNCQNKWFSRRWPAERWIELGRALSKKNGSKEYNIFLIGSKKDYEQNEVIRKGIGDNTFNISGELSLTETVAFLKEIPVFITTDSGPMHMAFAAGTKKVITLFGSTNPELFVNKNMMQYAIWKNKGGKYCPLYNHNNEPLVNPNECMSIIKCDDVENLICKKIMNLLIFNAHYAIQKNNDFYDQIKE
jgi:heptosyltransferase-3